MIKINVKHENRVTHKTECLIVFCAETAKPEGDLKKTDSLLKGAVARAMKDKRFEGKLNQTLLIDTLGTVAANHILLAGVGKKEELNLNKLFQASGSAAKRAEKAKCKKIACAPLDSSLSKKLGAKKSSAYDPASQAVAEGLHLSLYRFEVYKTKKKGDPEPVRVKDAVLLAASAGAAAGMKRGAGRAKIVADATAFTRDLQCHPGNTATPSFLARQAQAMAKSAGLKCRIVSPPEMQKLGMGALLGVGRGSAEPSKLILLEYSGGKKGQAPVALVGKGITFDTGGISLKPPPNMHEMKMDMSGGAAVIGALQAVAGLKLPVNVVGIIPAAENMPGSRAIKPGDILTSLSGKTIEVLNTDAEGRLVLSDALTYAARFKPRAIVDLATLTGAVLHCLGHHASAVVGSDQDLMDQLIQSGEKTGERVWQLPLWEEYESAIKSDVADLKNIAGPAVMAGTIMGGAFLKAFVDDVPWAHVDIAGVAWGDEKPCAPKGASGYGVRLLVNFLENAR